MTNVTPIGRGIRRRGTATGRDAQVRAVRRRPEGPGPTTVITVTSASGSVGRTTVTTNLAVALGARGRSVLILDLDVAHPSVDTLLGLECCGDVDDLFAGERGVDEILTPGPPGVHLIPGSSRLHAHRGVAIIEQAALIWSLDAMAQHFDVLLIDTASGFRAEVATFSRAAHHVIVVVDEKPGSIGEALEFIASLSREHGINHFKILANHALTIAAGAALFDELRRACDRRVRVTLELAGTVPRDASVGRSASAHRAMVQAEPHSASALAVCRIAARSDQWAPPDGVRGHLEFFIDRLVEAKRPGRTVGP
jgi:flagellar biosynthesis protein FlhG